MGSAAGYLRIIYYPHPTPTQDRFQVAPPEPPNPSSHASVGRVSAGPACVQV